jgi:hypothetical protein
MSADIDNIVIEMMIILMLVLLELLDLYLKVDTSPTVIPSANIPAHSLSEKLCYLVY